jgi:hypothetical protein
MESIACSALQATRIRPDDSLTRPPVKDGQSHRVRPAVFRSDTPMNDLRVPRPPPMTKDAV